MSFPLRERGLKLEARDIISKHMDVVPLAGTWIETIQTIVSLCRLCVVPLAGTWIETPNIVFDFTEHDSRSPCGNVD